MQSDNPDLVDLTDDERDALTVVKVEDTSDADAAAAKEKADADAAAAKAAEDAEAAKVVDKAPPATKPTPPNPDAPVFVPKIVDKASERDFDKELDALEAKYADPDSEMSLEEFKKAERALLREQTTAEVLAQVEARTQASAAAFQATQFNTAVSTFFNDPAHQDMVVDDKNSATPAFRAAFQRACDYVDDPKLSNAEVVEKAYKTLKITNPELFVAPKAAAEQTDDEKAAAKAAVEKKKADDAAAEKAKQDAINKRKPNTKDLPVTVGNAPNAGEDQDQDSTVDKLANLDIGELEDQLALMKPGDVDALLRKTPGSSVRGK